jgi:DNA-binding HxlR family transcriptional regulator
VTIIDLQMIRLEEKIKNYSIASDCPVRNVLDRIGDKWSILVISLLGESGTLRFNQLNHKIGNISQKMLTVTLKSLEADGLLTRKIYPEIPPRVEYTLTPLGESLLPALEKLTTWAFEKMPEILISRKAYGER